MTPNATQPVSDSVPKINDELAVGEDLAFQRRWWRFENAVWALFAVIIVLDLLGAFGRGPLANAEERSGDGALSVQYERVERFSTPSIMTIHFEPSAIHDGKVQLWMSNALLKPLGNQRIIPQPASSKVDAGGVAYTFDAGRAPASVDFALEPAKPGLYHLAMRIPGSQELVLKIFVMP